MGPLTFSVSSHARHAYHSGADRRFPVRWGALLRPLLRDQSCQSVRRVAIQIVPSSVVPAGGPRIGVAGSILHVPKACPASRLSVTKAVRWPSRHTYSRY